MKPASVALAGLLIFAVLTLWVEERWAWSIFQLGIFALAGWRITRTRPFHVPPPWAPLAAATLCPLVELFLHSSVSPSLTWNAALDWFVFLLVFLLASDLLSHTGARRPFLGILTIFASLLALIATAQKYSSGGKVFWLFPSGYPDDVLGPFLNRNQYAAWIELLLPAALWLAIAGDRRLRLLYGAAAAILFGAVVASASRAGFLLVCAESVAVPLMIRSRRAKRGKLLPPAIQFAMLALASTLILGWQNLWARWENGAPEVVRADAIRATIQMVRARPWTGWGLGAWALVYPRYAGLDTGQYVNQAHNDWLQWTAEGGIPFVLCMIFFAALLSKSATRSIYGLGVVAFLLHALVDYPMQQRPGLAVWFFAIAGATAAWRPGRQVELPEHDELLRGVGTGTFGDRR